MKYFPFDDINILENGIEEQFAPGSGRKPRKEDLIDEVTDLFIMTYFFGTRDVSEQMGENVEPSVEDARAVIEERFDDKNYIDRLNDYYENGTAADIKRVIDTDTHRIYNAALYDGAKKLGATYKTWNCMMLPTSRETHVYLDGATIPIDAEFYSFKGGSTLYPGQWGIAEEDCNCLCSLTFSKS